MIRPGGSPPRLLPPGRDKEAIGGPEHAHSREPSDHGHGGHASQGCRSGLELALSLDIPFWPQLPRVSYYEDMYVQASEHFPGIVLDLEKRTLRFSLDKFVAEYEEALNRLAQAEYWDVSETYSVVYHRFVKMDLSARPAIRGSWKARSVSA